MVAWKEQLDQNIDRGMNRGGRNIIFLRIAILLLSILFVVNENFAQTELPHTIDSDYILTRANSPYIANQDVDVNVGAKLIVEPGVTIYFQRNAGLYVEGDLDLNGTENYPIKLMPAPGLTKWEVVSIHRASKKIVISWVEITGTTEGDNSDHHRAAISAYKSTVEIDHCTITNVDAPIFFYDCDDVVVSNCTLHARDGCDYINFLTSNGLIENNEFIGGDHAETDAVDFDDGQGIIRGNYFHDFMGNNTDAIDIGGDKSYAIIENNIIENIYDKAISIGELAVAEVNYNLIINANGGIASKDLSVVNASNNTFYQCEHAYQAYSRDGIGWGGGELQVKNSIIFDCEYPITSRDNSVISINYSICNNQSISGMGNIFGDPLFENPSLDNFNLRENSPAIDSGDPNSDLDLDGTRADMGAFPRIQNATFGLLVSEIHYRPIVSSGNADDYEFIELYNNSALSIDLTGFRFTEGIIYTFRMGETIEPGEYLVMAKTKSNYNLLGIKLYEWWDGDLNDVGEKIVLKNDDDEIIFEFTYGSQVPWPQLGAENRSIELDPIINDFSQPNYWRLSLALGGSPGFQNDEGTVAGFSINEVLSKSTILFPDNFGDPSDWVEIYNSSAEEIDLGGLYVSNDSGDPGKYMIPDNSPNITTVQPYSYIVFYASSITAKGDMHFPFSLSSSGAEFGIYQNYGGEFVELDFIQIPSLTEGQTYGRMPDGSGDFEIIDNPTPGESNKGVSIDKYAGLKINEFVAKYDNTYPDEHGLNSDWIEIYNAGDELINLSGLFLSDDESNLRKSRIPFNLGDSAFLNTGGFIVFRADARPELGFNHCDFQLASSGEDVILSVNIDGDLQIIDKKTYSAQVTGKSFGRLGDGASEWVFFGTPSPGASNGATGIFSFDYQDNSELIIFPNPATDILTISFDSKYDNIEMIELYDINGRIMKEEAIFDERTIITWNLKSSINPLPPGFYFIHLRSKDKIITRRLVIK